MVLDFGIKHLLGKKAGKGKQGGGEMREEEEGMHAEEGKKRMYPRNVLYKL